MIFCFRRAVITPQDRLLENAGRTGVEHAGDVLSVGSEDRRTGSDYDHGSADSRPDNFAAGIDVGLRDETRGGNSADYRPDNFAPGVEHSKNGDQHHRRMNEEYYWGRNEEHHRSRDEDNLHHHIGDRLGGSCQDLEHRKTQCWPRCDDQDYHTAILWRDGWYAHSGCDWLRVELAE
jgi:hypothetical protein